MPRRAQNGGSMKESFDQQAAHSPAPSPSGSRQAGQSGGSATSKTRRNRARNPLRSGSAAETTASLPEVLSSPMAVSLTHKRDAQTAQSASRNGAWWRRNAPPGGA